MVSTLTRVRVSALNLSTVFLFVFEVEENDGILANTACNGTSRLGLTVSFITFIAI